MYPQVNGKVVDVSLPAQRVRNRAELQRASTVANVMERLEVFGLLARAQQLDRNVVRAHAETIVDAVVALLKVRSC